MSMCTSPSGVDPVEIFNGKRASLEAKDGFNIQTHVADSKFELLEASTFSQDKLIEVLTHESWLRQQPFDANSH